MNDTQPNTSSPQERFTKGLAVIGFIGLLILLAWLLIKSVGYVPTLINNVASVIKSDTSVELNTYPLADEVTHNSTIGLEWTAVDVPGTYYFSYTCTPGVSIELTTLSRYIQNVDCDTPYELGDLTAVDITIQSIANRFTDLDYTISFIPDNDLDNVTLATNQIVVFNPNISIANANNETDFDSATSTDPTNTDESDDDASDPAPTEPTLVTPRPSTPTYVTQYEIPVSDPNGTTNLRVQYLGVGTLNTQNVFTPKATLANNTTGAIRFVVKNTGTRTSDTWIYNATLPNGQEYTSSQQRGLKPNETATLTLGFRTSDIQNTRRFNVEIDTARDSIRSDNGFDWSVAVR